MIFLSKHGQDSFINMFAQGHGYVPVDTDDFVYESSTEPVVLRGILKYKLMQQCLRDRRDFYYMDTGYFGNSRWKEWHRVVKNDLQHSEIIPRPADRWQQLGIKIKPWQRSGRNILLALPDEKPCRYYGIDRQQWLEQTVATIKQHTDRPVVIRERAPRREDRVADSFQDALQRDVFAVVTFNSIAAVESVLSGIPAFTLSPTHAAAPVTLQDLSKIETPLYADSDLMHSWACHLAYGQVHVSELKAGTAMKIIQS